MPLIWSKFLSLVYLYYETLNMFEMCAQRINYDLYALKIHLAWNTKLKESYLLSLHVFIHMVFLSISYMQRRIKTQDAKRWSKAILLRISMRCDYHQSYAGAQGAKPMKMVLIRKLVFMVTGSYCDVTYAKHVTWVCVCVPADILGLPSQSPLPKS